jgi:repressor LexA
MEKVTTAERLRYIINTTGLKQVDILEKCKPYCEKYNVKLAKNDLSQYVSGKVEPKQNKLSILGLALDVSEAWLAGYDVPMGRNDNIIPITTQRLPLLGEIACGIPRLTNESLESYIEVGTNVKANFCLRAKGDSMVNARIYDGDIVFVRSQDTVENGEVAVVIIDDEATLKRVFYYPEQSKLVLQAENPKYEPFVYVGDELQNVKILGKAIAFQSDVK